MWDLRVKGLVFRCRLKGHFLGCEVGGNWRHAHSWAPGPAREEMRRISEGLSGELGRKCRVSEGWDMGKCLLWSVWVVSSIQWISIPPAQPNATHWRPG